MATLTPGPHTHEQWLGLVQPVGLVVAPAVLSTLQLFPNQSTPYLSARQRQLEGLLEEVEGPGGQPLSVVPSVASLATELLDWGEADLVAAHALESVPEVVLAEYGETLCPSHGVPKFEGEGLQALVLDLTRGATPAANRIPSGAGISTPTGTPRATAGMPHRSSVSSGC